VSRPPFASMAAATVALGLPLGLTAIVAAGRGGTLWVILHGCARVGAVGSSLLALVALALLGSALGAGLCELVRQLRIGRRALVAAQAHRAAGDRSLQALARDLGLRRLVVVEAAEPLAFCAGIVRPRVVVSTAVVAVMEPPALRALLAHEGAHARRRDPLRQVLAAVAARALWLAPAASAVAAHRRLHCELAADRQAARQAGPRALAGALLAMHHAQPSAAHAALAGGASLLQARVDALHGAAAPRLRLPAATLARTLLGAALAAGVLAGLAVAPAASADPLLPMPMDLEGTLEMAFALAARAAALVALAVGVSVVLGRRPWPSRSRRLPA
jgi:beta-lactamase regulating signal transducer with metallopeptidase domain